MTNQPAPDLPSGQQDFQRLQLLVDQTASTRDSFRLSRQLRELSQQHKRGRDISFGWQQWHAALLKTQALTDSRRQTIPVFTYPELPVSARADEIAELLSKHQVIVVAGETGSGKTTQIPKICLQAGRGVRGLIGHTQPRRIAARTVATRIAEELKVKMGEAVGYQVRFSDQSSPNSLIKLMTDGILLAEIQRDRFLSAYDTLIIDEAHERSLNIDFLLGYLKNLLPQRPDLKVIITSATIDVAKFSKHFNDAPVVEVSGRSFPVEIIYNHPDDVESDRDQMIVDCLQDIHTNQKAGDVLIFLSGEREIREVNLAIKRAQLPHTEVVPLYARLSLAEQSKIFSPHRGRRIVLSTNVAETSLTVPGIRYVIDTGRARVSRYSFRTKVQRLPIEVISQASANQRAGRCGRVADGVCYRLYSEEDFQGRPAFTDPEIIRTNLAAVILQMLHLRIGDIRNFPFVDPPDQRMISDGFKLLEELQAVTQDDKLSSLGKRLVNIPLDPRFARMLLESANNGCLAEVMIITTGLSIQDPRERPADKQQAADQSHKKWQEPNSDFVSLLNLWRHFEEQRQNLSGNQYSRYCKSNHVSYLRMREWRDLHHQVHTACRGLKLTSNTEPAEQDAIHRSILSGLLGQVGILQDKWEYLGTRNRKFFIFPGSGLSKKPPKWLMAGSLMETTKQFALTVAKIDSDWLEPLAAHLVKKSYSEPFYNKKSGQVMAKERQTLFGLSIVENKNRVYGQVAPQEARKVFVQQALVEEGYRGKGQFYSHNHKLVEELQALEDRFRRRDLLVEQQAIFDFYDQRVPGGIYNLAAFEKWRKQAEAKTPKLLMIDKEYLLLRGLSQDEQAQFPESISCDGIAYQLRYHFQPGHAEDGVSAVVPLALLHQLPRYFFEWLVPGMLRDKCIALVKSLPKQTRRHFVPVPDHVGVFLRKAKPQDRPLTEVLAEHLRSVSGVIIEPEQWRQESLDSWYQMNFVLEDEQGAVIAMARSLEQLQRDFKQQISQGLEKAADQSASRQGITEWDFDELLEEVALQHGKITIKAWPALRDCGDSVSLEVMDNPLQAQKISRRGQLRLALLRGREQVKYLEKNLLRGKDLALKAANVGARQHLIDPLISASFQQALFLDQQVVRGQQQFDQAYEQGISQVVGLAQDYTASIESLLPGLHDLQKQLRSMGLPAIYAAEDIRNQLDWLFATETLCSVTDEIISHYPRYIKAIQVRVEKLTSQQSKDRQHIAEISDLLVGCREALVEDQPLSSDLEAALLDYCWLVEEYRVSLFAQQLKTKVPVSLKRLNKRWAEIDEQLRRFRVQSG
ncbi:ATP-dependent RNA helicase HrpA [Porticoccaceae bacterium]|nr:ATP-dependent RNA helicase HrpA [Porticoccaceae bacterium]MDC1453428.1 ATP-dependent RNA helicase HrpA [Porticoccaceae bacterium]